MKRFRGGLEFKAHRLSHHSTLGLRVTKKRRRRETVAPDCWSMYSLKELESTVRPMQCMPLSTYCERGEGGSQCVCVCVCVREREIEIERESVCVRERV